MARFLIPSMFDAGTSAAARGGADPFLQLHREVNRLFDDALRGQGGSGTQPGGPGGATLSPRMNISETDRDILIAAELPGVPEGDVHVELNGDTLTIAGEKRVERQDAQHHLVERHFGTFSRTVRLPFEPNPDQVRAQFEHGVLRITLPKAPPEARSRRIPVQMRAPGGAGGDNAGAAVAGHPTPSTTQRAGRGAGGGADQGEAEAEGHPT